MSDMKRVLNWRPSPADVRDLKLMDMRAMRGAAPLESLPASWDLRDKCTPVRDQGQTGECTGQSVCGAAEFLSLKTTVNSFVRKSVKFAYYNGRRTMFPSQVHVDSGCYIRTVIKAAARYGIAEETLWPESNYFGAKPSVSAYADATRFQILEYGALTGGTPSQTVDNIRRTIYHGLPVCFGFDVYESFMSAAVASSGVATIPKAGEMKEGGHAVLAVGYDDDASMLIVRNSWGDGWGDKGYFKLPYWFVLNGRASDFWTISAQENGEAAAGWFSGIPGYLFGHSEKEW